MTRDEATPASDELVQISVVQHGAHPLVALQGELDLSNAQQLREALDRVPLAKLAAIDMTELTFIDSTGLGAIAQFGKRLRDAGGALYLVVTRPAIRKVLSITSLDKHFPVVERRDDVPVD